MEKESKEIDKTPPDIEGTSEKKLKYPYSVFFIISNEFCERFCFYGMKTVLTIYLVEMLKYSKDTATTIFHTWSMLVYFFPVLGAMIADSWLGKFSTIFYLSIVYAIGSIVIALAATPPLNFPAAEISMVGLVLIAIGTGGIKPCVAAFGGDQFILPQQEKYLTMFFSLFYFAINCGGLLSTFLTPIIRSQSCFGSEECFTLAFGIPAILMIASIVIFACGKRMYIDKEPEGNMLIKCSKCIGNAISVKRKSTEKKEHWLDYAVEKHGKKLVEEVKITLSVLFLYIPLPVFWALFEQEGSTWTFLARNMDGDIGFYTILPDQMMVANPILILIFIPLFEYVIYPICDKLKIIQTPLQRLVVGGLLAALAFICSACVSIAVENEQPVLPSSGIAHLNLYNNLNCDLKFTSLNVDKAEESFTMAAFSFNQIVRSISHESFLSYDITSSCYDYKNAVFMLRNEEAFGYYINDISTAPVLFEDDLAKDEDGSPFIRVLASGDLKDLQLTITDDDGDTIVSIPLSNHSRDSFDPGEYKLSITDQSTKFKFRLGGGYVILVDQNTDLNFQVLEITKPNGVHMLLLLPQYIILTMGEIMYSVTGLEFSYSQAPANMKSVLQSFWLLTTAFGNLLVIIINAIPTFERQSNDLFLYAGVMIVDMIVFTFMAMRYKYVEKDDKKFIENEEIEPRKSIKRDSESSND